MAPVPGTDSPAVTTMKTAAIERFISLTYRSFASLWDDRYSPAVNLR